MEETFVTFKTAKLAKESGFNVDIRTYFDFDKFGEKVIEFFGKLNANKFEKWSHELMSNVSANYISCPTQSLLQKWLRDKHKLIVIVSYNYEYDSTSYCYFLYKELGTTPLNEWKYDFSTYEEALEKGLEEALKLIKQ